jgi:hypothetical protein
MERNFRPKSQEHLQAQVEAFSDKGVKEFSDEQKKLLQHSAELAKIDDIDNLPSDLSPELVELIESNRKRYIEFLRREKREEIQFRKENAERLKEKFEPAIKTLKEKIKADGAKEQYLGSGSNGDAYRIEVDGREYAAKFSRSLTQANFEIKPLLRADGIEHAAQLAAYSFEHKVVIMELLPGTDVTNFSPENAPEYSDEDIAQLIETVQELDRNGLVIDPKPSNFLYDEKEGFSVLDFHLKEGDHYSLADSIMSLRIALTERKWPRLDYKADDYQEKSAEQSIERNKVYLPMMVRFLTILRDKFPEILEDYKRAYAEKEADPRISQSPIIDRRYIQTDHSDLAPQLQKLEELGF